MKKSESSNKYDLGKFTKISENYEINLDELMNLENISKTLKNKNECINCKKESYIEIKKFKPLDEQLDLEKLDDDFGRCSCGKRHIDISMAQILKIMKEEDIEFRRFNLRNGPIPLLTTMYSNKNEPFIEKNSLIILYPTLTKKIANRIIDEVSEVKGVIKGDPKDTVGIIDTDYEAISYELLTGSDIRCDIVKSPAGEIVINKIQHLSYLEFPPSMENKIARLWEYLEAKHLSKEETMNLNVLDGTCGNGTLGIFLLKLGVKKVVFNDIWTPATIITSINLELNGFKQNKGLEKLQELKESEKLEEIEKLKELKKIKIPRIEESYGNTDKISYGTNFELYNLPFEELSKILSKKAENIDENKDESKKFDICILDCFPEANSNNFKKIAKSIAKDVFII
ncbi:50S ribosomal protein L11 methyltransferase [Methanobrevibacter sp. TMH8]|uniref:50S ribosomal protein L11 methyltransferase n=1 Tax=Methanobrevibacter sp. TMH8 TaxID=2848611 RepID=UPI001CCB12D3|nr:50S ribosomal protein L11 methyltransferase [Methanobrevibacter sp. TMH8]MBZ9570792.1 50S ribosomal protein L11 methyltransferase [Methanobrevibacter sp. TMH8]